MWAMGAGRMGWERVWWAQTLFRGHGSLRTQGIRAQPPQAHHPQAEPFCLGPKGLAHPL